MLIIKNSFLKIVTCFILILAFFPFSNLGTILFAEDEELDFSLTDLIEQNGYGTEQSQEITNDLGINTDFESGTTEGWTYPTYNGIDFTNNTVGVADFTSENAAFSYGDEEIKYSSIGTDGISNNKFGLFFIVREKETDDNGKTGVAGIESPEITIPAHAYYVLTFNVKVAKLDNDGTQYGVNAKVIVLSEENNSTISMNAIKSTSENYISYGFLIQGNEYSDVKVKIQFLFGNLTKSGEGEDKTTIKNEQLGYAAIDTIRMFSVTYSQFNDLSEDKNSKLVSLLSQNSDYINVDNGYFNITKNEKWNLDEYNSLNDFKPADWNQKVSSGSEAYYGIINTKKDSFNSILTQIGLSEIKNPGNADNSDIEKENNNVLMLYNSENAYQTIQSSNIIFTKNKYYKFSFKFNTPALSNQTNKLNFYLVDKDDNTIYKRSNIHSYVDYNGSNNEWATFYAFIKIDDTDKNLNFVIEFGTQENPVSGYVFIDDIILTEHTSQTSAFYNEEKDKYILKTEEGEEIQYLPQGTVTFEDLLKLDQNEAVNRNLFAYTYDIADSGATTPEEDDPSEPTTNPSSIAWYIVPSVLFGICLIGGIAIFYAKKIKIKRPAKKAKNTYDRTKTLNKQVKEKEKQDQIYQKQNYQNQLENIRKQINDLEKSYEISNKNKKSQLSLNSYLSKRQKLQNKEAKILEQIEKFNK